MISLQALVVALLVPLAALYAAWKLMPATARRALATVLLRWPQLPAPVVARLRRHASAANGCGCDGCDRAEPRAGAPKTAPPAVQPITFHPRPRR